MTHPIHRVVSADVAGPFTLRIRFDDGLERRIDFSPILVGELLGPLRELALFNQVRVDPEVHTVVWPNGADFDPATLHDWPIHEAAFPTRGALSPARIGVIVANDRVPKRRRA